MKKENLKDLSLEQLNERLAAEKSTVRNLRFAHAISPLENPMRIRHTRRLVAQLLTELRNRDNNQNS